MLSYLKLIYGGSMAELCETLYAAMEKGEKRFVITANPEIMIRAEKNPTIRQMLLDSGVSVVPDGISIVRAMRQMKYPVAERIAGIDLAEHMLTHAGEKGLSVYLLGASEETVSTLAAKYRGKYPEMQLHFHNGFDGDKDAIFQEEIKKYNPDLVLVALGVPAQELLIYKHYQDFYKGIFIGVGGSFDVLSGKIKRAPRFFLKTNTEWLHRIITQPFRIKRFFSSNVLFVRRIAKLRKESKRDEKN